MRGVEAVVLTVTQERGAWGGGGGVNRHAGERCVGWRRWCANRHARERCVGWRRWCDLSRRREVRGVEAVVC